MEDKSEIMEPLEESPADRVRRQMAKRQEARVERLRGKITQALQSFAALTPEQKQILLRELIRGKKT